MAMVNVVLYSFGGRPALVVYLSDEPGELSQWLCHGDSTVNIVVHC